MALFQMVSVLVVCALGTASVAGVALDDDDALLLQLQHQTVNNPNIINSVSSWPEDKLAILVDEATCAEYQCGDGQVLSGTSGCGAAYCSEAQCCSAEAICIEYTCMPGTVLIKSDGCGAVACFNEHCCDDEDTCESVSCLEGYVPIVDKVGCGKTQCDVGDCCAQRDTCNQFQCGDGYLQHVGEDHICEGAQCVRNDCCDEEATCEQHMCEAGFVNSGVFGGCNALSCTTGQCCVPEAICDDHSCQEGMVLSGSTLSASGAGGCNAAQCSDEQCCVAQAFCSTHTCSPGTVKHRDGGCGALYCIDAQCCAEEDVCTSVTCPTDFIADPTIDAEFGCGKTQCEVGDCCAEAGNCNVFNCGLGYIKHRVDDETCNKEFCAKADCCTPEGSCDQYTCSSPGLVKTSTQGCAAIDCTDEKCCEIEALCSDWTCGEGLSKLHELGCAHTVCSDASCCVTNPIECVPSGSCQGQKESCDARTDLDFGQAVVKRNDLHGAGFLLGPVATMGGVSIDMLITVIAGSATPRTLTVEPGAFLGATIWRVTWGRMQFRFQDSTTQDLVVLESLMFSFIDLDGLTGGMFDTQGKWFRDNVGAERVTSCDAERVILSTNTGLAVTELDDGCIQVEGITDEDSAFPVSPDVPLTQAQMANTAVFVFEGKSTFNVDFQHVAPPGAKSGRKTKFAAKASFACEW